jgi:S1-C subfamily serine protease
MRKRAPVFSSSRRLPAPAAPVARPAAAANVEKPPAKVEKPKAAPAIRKPLPPRFRTALAVAGLLLPMLVTLGVWLAQPEEAPLLPRVTEAEAPPANAAEAFERIRGAVVYVRGLPYDGTEDVEVATKENVGTGVVIVDDGTILTNLHVVHGSKRIKVTFANGLEVDAAILGARPEHDLAVLKPASIPDDLEPATMRSTAGLRPGEEVVAVGFPFGIGPSASAGVISGLGREYRSGDGKRSLTNLIQFDAAVNPGNSGGPLVTTDGEVIGIVTGLLNPTEQRVFIGIGFAVPIENAAGAIGLSPF